MLGVMLQKLWHKKWMVVCLLIGSILLVATVVSFPMYRGAAFDRMLRDEFAQELAETGEWPAKLEVSITSRREIGGHKIQRIEELMSQVYDKLGVTKKDTVLYYGTERALVSSRMNRSDFNSTEMRLAMLSDFPAHIQMRAGEMYSEDGYSEDGSIEVVISQECMVTSRVLLGETLEFKKLVDAEGNPIRIKITGIFEQKDVNDFYWQVSPKKMSSTCLMNEQLFREMFTGDNAEYYTIICNYFSLFEYEDLKTSGIEALYNETMLLRESSDYSEKLFSAEYTEILEAVEKKQTRIDATLSILQIPVLILLCAFLFMISSQMYDMERNEISVLKSRGSSGGQIFRLYLYQSIFLTLVGALLGIPLGTLFCRILGSAQNFLEFDIRRQLDITYNIDVFLYALAAMLYSVLVMTLPAIKHSKVSIVNLKQQKATKKKSLWEKCFLDVICLTIGIYGCYNFSVNENVLIENVLSGETLDPLLYFSSSVFIVGAGLLCLRLQPILVKGIYLLGKNRWKPASYASFMENIKNGRSQQFIMLFLILTVSLGMYHATVARTILENAIKNEEYLNGADVVIMEAWDVEPIYAEEEISTFLYIEPDYHKYEMLDAVQSKTKVFYDEEGYIIEKGKETVSSAIMGIHTKEFGQNTDIEDGLLEKPYYAYLNELAVTAKGILVSRNFQTVQGYNVGDSITYKNESRQLYSADIVGFFDYWPGYEPTTIVLNSDGSITEQDNYLVVAHYSALRQQWGNKPYEVWLTVEDAGNDELYEWIEENDIKLRKYANRQENINKVIEDPLLQGTNGVLTMGFIVTMILCAVGYIIYWILSIRSREMIFGVLRACGMHKGELFHMLINEQIFSGAFSVLVGIGIGKLASKMFVPMLQTAYAASDQVLPMELITNQTDMLRLYGVIAGTMAICLLVIIVIVFKLNVAKALKLGEE